MQTNVGIKLSKIHLSNNIEDINSRKEHHQGFTQLELEIYVVLDHGCVMFLLYISSIKVACELP